MTDAQPEIASSARIGDFAVNYHDRGAGEPVLLIHGSGPGVTAWANWRGVMSRLESRFRFVAPDMLGFGFTDGPAVGFDIDAWVSQVVGLMDRLELSRASVIGNSFGGAIAAHLAERHPERVDRLVLMGSAILPFEMTPGLDAVWGYEPSQAAMGHLLRDVFVFNGDAITDDLVESRYRASAREGVQERYRRLFPAPRQRWVDALALTPERLAAITHRVLLVHGRGDSVIPVEVSLRAAESFPDASVEVIEECGHWVQVEHPEVFCELVAAFLREGRA